MLTQSSPTSLLSRFRFDVFRLQTSEKMQGFHVENGIEGAIWPPIQELLLEKWFPFVRERAPS